MKKTTLAIIGAVTLGLTAHAAQAATQTAPAAAAPAQAAQNGSGKLKTLAADVGVIESKVVAVDLKQNTVTIDDGQGGQFTIYASKKVDLSKVKVGDIFAFAVAESVAAGVEQVAKGTPLGVASSGSVTVSSKDAKRPFEETVNKVYATARVLELDRAKGIVKIELPEGKKRVVHVPKEVSDLSKVSVGDTIMIEFTQETLVGFMPAPKATKK